MKTTFLLICFISIFAISIYGQSDILSREDQVKVIDSTCVLIERYYIDDERASEMTRLLRKNLRQKKYDTITEAKAFAAQIERDLYPISLDKHFHFQYNPEAIKASRESGEDATLNALLNDRRINHGFREVKVMDGNIGYLKLDRIPYPSDAEAALVGAMAMLSNTDALIIDLSDNRGGYNEMLQFFFSYFFEYPVLLNTLTRKGEEPKQFWTYPYRDGKLLDSLDLYILTSRRTFSAGEWFAYSMQQHQRAVIVGEVSKGGATPSEFYYVDDRFMIMIPNSTCICPKSGRNFNNVGVLPDVQYSYTEAIDRAYLMAVDSLLSSCTNPEYQKEYKWIADGLKAGLEPFEVDAEGLAELTGNYGRSEVLVKDKQLYFKTGTGNLYKLLGVEENYYCLEGLEHFRIRFEWKEGKVVSFSGLYSNGYIQTIPKHG